MLNKSDEMLTGPMNCKMSETIISRSATRILVRANIHTALDIVLLSSGNSSQILCSLSALVLALSLSARVKTSALLRPTLLAFTMVDVIHVSKVKLKHPTWSRGSSRPSLMAKTQIVLPCNVIHVL